MGLAFLAFQKIRIHVVGCGDEGFFDTLWRYPSQQVEHGSGFIVGSGSPAAAERLLVDDSSGRFVVDVEIAGCMCQAVNFSMLALSLEKIAPVKA